MAPSPPCFRNNSLGYAGLPGECWIPVPLPPPTSSWQTFSRRPRDGAAEPINQSKPAVDVADHNCDRLLNINSSRRKNNDASNEKSYTRGRLFLSFWLFETAIPL
jgi:hypothetical protein